MEWNTTLYDTEASSGSTVSRYSADLHVLLTSVLVSFTNFLLPLLLFQSSKHETDSMGRIESKGFMITSIEQEEQQDDWFL